MTEDAMGGEREADLGEARRQAWITRRRKYGPQGHGTRCCGQRCESMLALIIRLHVDEALSEGQVAKATGLDRVTVRGLREAEERRLEELSPAPAQEETR